jgi:hypothetical protein
MNPLHYVDRKSIASQLISNGGSLVQRNVVRASFCTSLPSA